jgi:radical SAM superfamily enzyme YgiQ (UPF0313 family)
VSDRGGLERILHFGYAAPTLPDPGGRLPVALVFPGPAKLGLSTLGWQCVYRLLTEAQGFLVERFFQARGGETRGYDSGTPLSSHPLIALSLNCEEDILTFAGMLRDAGIPLHKDSRGDWPVILAGGPVAWLNPAPATPMVDAFWVGEAGGGMADLLARARQYWLEGRSGTGFLEAVRDAPGVYAPGLTTTPVRRVVDDASGLTDPAYSLFLSSRASFPDMMLLEVNRGCPYACRFCAAGFIYRPPRQADPDRLKAVVAAAGPRKVGLVGTALTDWEPLPEFLNWLHEQKIKFSLGSVRADGLTPELLEFLRRTGTRTLTLALEAPSARLRRAANKHFHEQAFLDAVRRMSRLRFNHLKVYLIVGWPGETMEDYDELEEFMRTTEEARLQGSAGRAKGLDLLTLGVNPLVPKPATPMQFAPMAGQQHLERVYARLRDMAGRFKGLRLETESIAQARIQAVLARGGEECFDLVQLALETGSWKKGLKAWDRDAAESIHRERSADEGFPWEVVDTGVSREHLLAEWERYKQGRPGGRCPRHGCRGCNACGLADWL